MGVYNQSPMEKKVRDARRAAMNQQTGNAARETVARNTKTAGVKLSVAEERAAQKVLQARIKIDRGKTAARGAAIQKVQEKKAAAKRMAAATGNSQSKATAKPTPKATAKPTVKATPKSAVKPTPAPSPTSISQLKPYLRLKNPETGMMDDVRKGIFKGKSYDVDPVTKKITLNVKDTKSYIAGIKRDKASQ